MKRSARKGPSPGPARGPGPRAERRDRGALLDVAVLLGCVALAAWVQRAALDAWFSHDDLAHFERIRGLLPDPLTVWRWLSNQIYLRASLDAFGADPGPYHLLNGLCHAVNVGLVFVLARVLGAPRAGAALTAGLFGTSRLYLPALFQAVGLGELAALTGTLLALLLVRDERPALRAAALVPFALALLLKETVAFLPAVLLVSTGRTEPLRARLIRVAPLLVVGVGYFAFLTLGHVDRIATPDSAYGTGLGVNLFHNLMTYCMWAVDLVHPSADQSTSIVTTAWKIGIPVLLSWIAVAVAMRRRTRLPWIGLAWFILGLVPVLPLLHQSHAYYLYSPCAGLALALGGAFAAAFRHRTAWLAVVALLGLHAWQSDRLIGERLRLRVPGSDLLLDPFVRKSEVARSLVTSLEPSLRGRRAVRALVYKPDLGARYFDAGSGRETSAQQSTGAKSKYDLTLELLDHGRVPMALYPQLDTLFFAEEWTPELSEYEIHLLSGRRIVPIGQGVEGVRGLVSLLVRNGYPDRAVDMLQRAIIAFPADQQLRVDLAELQRGGVGQQ